MAFAAMEVGAARIHRSLMHGPGWGWHRSHHSRRQGRLQTNDRYPVVFATATATIMVVATVAGWGLLFAAAAGVTAYGLAYALVHDVCVHGRLTGGRPVLPGRWLRWVADCHAVHHRWGRAPYGFLAPIVPSRYRSAVETLRYEGTRTRAENTS